MLVRRVSLQNVRSFRERADLLLDGRISILIGPNGGGKTNLLDATAIMLRKQLFASMYAARTPTPEQNERFEFRHNEVLNNLILEKHSGCESLPQSVEVEIEVTSRDIDSMSKMSAGAAEMSRVASSKYVNLQYRPAEMWDLAYICSGQRLVYTLNDGILSYNKACPSTRIFLEYLRLYEIDSFLREEYGQAKLTTPMVYLPVNRTSGGLSSNIELAGYDRNEQKRQNDGISSRNAYSSVQLAIGRLAERHRILLEEDKGQAKAEFRRDENLQQLTTILRRLGYEWDLVCTSPVRNSYDIQLSKQGTSFLVSRASSGERELLTYLFTIFGLNVRDALIVVDEPELHLHPKWQSTLFELFEELSALTGNQFLLATHSPTFISPSSIGYVSRVHSENQRSRITRLAQRELPDAKHLLSIVNSQNNEKIFFADRVVLVEGISDRIFFEQIIRDHGPTTDGETVEVVDVGGKGLFRSYERVLSASHVPYSIIADLDYVREAGSAQVKGLFAVSSSRIKKAVIDDVSSRDGASLVRAIDTAIASGSWEGAEAVWSYIKSRQIALKPTLTTSEKRSLSAFIARQRRRSLFILREGSLEDYLPPGHRGKI